MTHYQEANNQEQIPANTLSSLEKRAFITYSAVYCPVFFLPEQTPIVIMKKIACRVIPVYFGSAFFLSRRNSNNRTPG